MRAVLILIAVMWLALPARSDVAGQDDPELQAAIGDWLAGNEAQALPAMADMAAGGNTAARLLLGQIDSFPALQGDWLGGLSRADRIAVLRAPGRMSGLRWTKGLDDPVAQVWARLWDTSATAQVIVDFARLGEPRAARFAALTLARRQRAGFAMVANDPAYPAALRAYAVREWQKTDPQQAAAESFDPGDPQVEVLGQTVDPVRFSEWAATAALADPVLALCEALCPAEDPAICRPAALTGLGGFWGLAALGSPVEALVPSAVYNRSPRGLAVTLRQIRGPVESACLKQALQ